MDTKEAYMQELSKVPTVLQELKVIEKILWDIIDELNEKQDILDDTTTVTIATLNAERIKGEYITAYEDLKTNNLYVGPIKINS